MNNQLENEESALPDSTCLTEISENRWPLDAEEVPYMHGFLTAINIYKLRSDSQERVVVREYLIQSAVSRGYLSVPQKKVDEFLSKLKRVHFTCSYDIPTPPTSKITRIDSEGLRAHDFLSGYQDGCKVVTCWKKKHSTMFLHTLSILDLARFSEKISQMQKYELQDYIKKELPVASTTCSLNHQPTTTALNHRPTTSSTVHQLSASALSHQPTTSSMVHQPTASALSHQPTTSSMVPQPTAIALSHQPITSSMVHQPTASALSHQPTTSSMVHYPSASALNHRPTTSSTVHQPTAIALNHRPTSSIVHQPTASALNQWSTTSSTVHQLSASALNHRPTTSSMVHQLSASSLNHRLTTSSMVHQPTASVLNHQPTQSALHHQPSASVLHHQPIPDVLNRHPMSNVSHHQPTPAALHNELIASTGDVSTVASPEGQVKENRSLKRKFETDGMKQVGVDGPVKYLRHVSPKAYL